MRYILLFLFFIQIIFANEKVSLQLKWLHQFQFAGYYMAKEKGFYDEVGLDVEIKQRDLTKNNIEQVINKESQYGIADSILLLYKAKKEPIVIVSPIFQHSAGVILTLKDSNIKGPYDLDNKKLTFYKKDTDGFAILALLKSANVDPLINRKKERLSYLDLVNRKVDAYSAYITNEAFYLKQLGVDFNIINPSNYGFDFYGDMIFTNKEEAQNNPTRVENFKKASLKGWEYALNNKEETIQLIKKKYAKDKSIEHLRYEADAIEQLIKYKYTPLGTLDEGRIKYTQQKYEEYGLIKSNIDLNEFIFAPENREIKLTKEEKKWLKDNKKIKLLAEIGHEPYTIKNNENSYSGIVVDYLNLIAKTINHEIELVFFDKNKNKTNKLSEDSSIFGSIFVFDTELNRQSYALTKPYINTSFNFFTNIKNQHNIKSTEDLKNKKVAVLKNDTTLINYLKKYKDVEIVFANSPKEQLELVQYNKVTAAIGYENYNYLISKMLFDKIVPAFTAKSSIGIHMGIRQKDTIFASILNKAIDKIGEKKKQEIINKWLIKNKNRIFLTPKEQEYLKNKKFIKMCIDPNWMPFEKIEEGKHIGISADYMNFFEKEIGIPIKLLHTSNWIQSVDYVRNRECDILSLAISTKSRLKYLDFTTPYIKSPMVVATKINKPFISSVKTLERKKIGIIKGFAFVEILREQYPKIDLVEIDNIYEGLEQVRENRLFGFIGTLESIGFNIQKDFIGQIKVAGKFDQTWDLSVATRNDEPLLDNIFNKAINKLTLDKKQEIFNKWISINYQKGINYTIIFKWVMSIILIFSIILYIVIKANQKLNREIRTRKRIEQKLKRYINIVDENVITSATNLDGIITNVSSAFCRVSGYKKEELIGQRHSIIRHPDMSDKIYKQMWENLNQEKSWEGELKNKTKNGNTYWVKTFVAPLYDEYHKKIGYTSIRQNITHKKLLEEISITDELTKLYNRRHFNNTLPKIINRAKRKNENINFVILDVDFFKRYNDTYGHIKGDIALIKIAHCLQTAFSRADDYCFRLGGEEFGVLFKDTSKEKAVELVEKLRRNIEKLKLLHEKNSASKYVTASFGVVTLHAKEVKEMQSLYKIADKLLYKAKETGRNKVESN